MKGQPAGPTRKENQAEKRKERKIERFKNIHTTAVPLPINNVDTDQIIPARFLNATERKGFGENLFRDWRYDSEGAPIKNFVLNDPKYSGGLLLCGRNFGSGSSREHAAWALYDYGFRVVVSTFFADIFRNNALNIGLLPIEVSESELQAFFKTVQQEPRTVFKVDLKGQTLENVALTVPFDISPHKKECLLEGLDDLGFLLGMIPKVEAFESERNR